MFLAGGEIGVIPVSPPALGVFEVISLWWSGVLLQQIVYKLVIGFFGNLLAEGCTLDLTLLVDDDESSGEEAAQGTVDEFDAVGLTEVTAECRGGAHLVDTLGCTETSGCKGEVHRNAEHLCVGQRGYLLVEAAYRSGAYTGVDRGENVEDNILATQIVKRDFREVLSHEGEIGSLLSGGGESVGDVHGVAVKLYCFHFNKCVFMVK